VAKLGAHLLATAALWVRVQTSPKKYIMGDIGKGVTITLVRLKNIKKLIIPEFPV
jgi:hypothetical protein